MIFHLGSRVGALVDGQLPPAQAERAWSHVHACASCRAAVEREGWIKRELASLSFCSATPRPAAVTHPAAEEWPPLMIESRPRKFAGLAAIGAGSVGAAMFGVLVLGGVPTDAPVQDRRLPVTNIDQPTSPETPTRRRGTGQNVDQNDNQDDAAATLPAAWVRMGL